MDAGAPKDVTITCNHCKSYKVVKAHWKNCVIWSTCNECRREFKYEFKDWRQVFKVTKRKR